MRGRSQWRDRPPQLLRRSRDGERGRDETGSTTTTAADAAAAAEKDSGGGHRRGLGGSGGNGGGGVVVDRGCGCGDGGGAGGDGGGAPVDVTRCPRWRTARPVRRTRVGRMTA